jgi:Ca2+-binding RTX toxin-like protein
MPVFIGTTGNDNVTAAMGFDSLYGITGDDTLGSSIVGFDYWDGGQGNDYLFAQWGSPAFGTFDGGDGNDLIQPGNSGTTTNTVHSGAGNDTIESAAHFGLTDNSRDFIDLGQGNDLVYGPNGDSTYIGGTGTDTINMGNGNDTVYASAGLNSQIYAGSGNSVIWIADRAGSTATQIGGGAGNDTINGVNDQGFLYIAPGSGSGVNVVAGNNVGNHIYGQNNTGSLWIVGGNSQDEYVGGHGNNHFIATLGGDFIQGGGLSNAFLFNGPGTNTHINNFNTATDVIGINANNFEGLFGGETLTLGFDLINGASPVANTATFLYSGGGLFFDADGTGAAAAPVLVAGLVNAPPTLSPNNFFVSAIPF